MQIKITGINGYLGTLISAGLVKRGHQVTGITRELLYGDTTKLSRAVAGTDVIINLAGVSILKRWTNKNKKLIYNSRIVTSSNLIKSINELPESDRPAKFLSASAIGIYKPNEIHDEFSTNYETGFVGKVVKDWEDVTDKLPKNIQKNIFRIGLVLGKKAKTIKNLRLPFKLGLGGNIGNGKQAFPFVHEKDVVNAFVWAVEDLGISGTYNLVAPEKITNKDFTKTFAKKVNRPAFIPVPAIVLKVVFGKAASLLLESPEVVPRALADNGFEFEYPTIELAFTEILA
jgi:uncharacterized protein (TIGR01777 family)